MTLVDTSVWVDHFRKGVPRLVDLLNTSQVSTHPFMLGELACGNLANRERVLDLLGHLPSAFVATEAEALHLIERHELMGRGLGYIDVHLLAASLLTPDTLLWTHDKPLSRMASALGVGVDRPGPGR